MNSLKDAVAVATDATHVILGASGNTGSSSERCHRFGIGRGNLKVGYHKPVTKDTGLLRAKGQLLSFSQRVALAEAKPTEACE